MIELLFQDSYVEFVLPLTIAVIWILGWQLFTLSNSVQMNSSVDSHLEIDVFIAPFKQIKQSVHAHHQLIRTVKRKECPDNDSEGPHSLFLFN